MISVFTNISTGGYPKREVKKRVIFVPIFTLLILSGLPVFGQEVKVETGPESIAENQNFTISITIMNERLREYGGFPEIEGFMKRGVSSSSRTNIVNGKVTSSQTITMNYVPRAQGTYELSSFELTVNGKQFSHPGVVIIVTPPVQQRQQRGYDPFTRDPFEEFFGKPDETEFIEIEADAFFALTTNKEEVYQGEGFTMNLAFYVSEQNQASLRFFDLGRQIGEILKKVRPANCWEENFNIENVTANPVVINNKRFNQYKIYQASFFPLSPKPIEFPRVGLEMVQYKVARRPNFYGANRQEEKKTFYSKAKTIRVKELPPHPLRNQVAVGNFKLDERMNPKNVSTGESVAYDFSIYGEGNIASIQAPEPRQHPDVQFYKPNITQHINRKNNTVTGSKVFSYYAIPREPGNYDMGNYFQWIYFNTKTEAYDTLKGAQVFYASGESLKDVSIQSADPGAFYDRISFEDNTLKSLAYLDHFKIGINVLILLMLGLTVFIIFKK